MVCTPDQKDGIQKKAVPLEKKERVKNLLDLISKIVGTSGGWGVFKSGHFLLDLAGCTDINI
jgi:hypothetical protein